MAVPLVQINGKVLLPDGSTAAGIITAELSQSGSVLDGATSQKVAAQSYGTIGADGTVTLSLVPNDAITPSGTSYLVTLRYGPAVVREIWQLASAPNPINIGAVPRLNVVPGVTVPPVADATTTNKGILELAGDLGGTALVPQVIGAHLAGGDIGAGTVVITGGISARSAASRFADRPTPFDFGAIGDGLTHPLSTRYGTLGAAQAVYPFATALTQEIDWAAIQAAINWWPGNGGPAGLPPAVYMSNATIAFKPQTSLTGSGGSIPDGSLNLCVIDATALATAIPAIDMTVSGSTYKTRLAHLGLRGSLSGAGTPRGVLVGTQAIIDDIYTLGFYYALEFNGATGAVVSNSTLQAPRRIGAYVHGGSVGIIFRDVFPVNAGQGFNDGLANFYFTLATDCIVDAAFIDECFGNNSAPVYVDTGALRIDIRTKHLYYAHGGYGLLAAAGSVGARLTGARVEQFAAGANPVNTVSLAGTGHVLTDVVTVASGGGDIADTSTDSIFQNVNGQWKYPTTDASGTPGNATINKASGKVAIAIGASTVTVTNSLVTAASIVTATLQTADATLTFIKSVVPGAGSFVITGNANATAATKVAFTVQN